MARIFNGTSDYILLADDPALDSPSAGWGLGGWAFSRSLPAAAGFYNLYTRGNFYTASFCAILIKPDSTLVAFAADSNSVFKFMVEPLALITQGTWFHFFLSNIDDDTQLYIDGISVASNTTTWAGQSSSEPVYLGMDGYGMNNLDGSLAEWARWNEPLSSDEIELLAAGVRPVDIGKRPDVYLPMSGGVYEEIAGIAVTNSGTVEDEHPSCIVPTGSVL